MTGPRLKELYGDRMFVDLGMDHGIAFTQWAPDRALNPQYVGVPDIARFGAIVCHRCKDKPAEWCVGAGINFDLPEVRRVHEIGDRLSAERGRPAASTHHFWQVQSWEPLTLTPSLLCRSCGDHGFIQNGKWVPA